MVELVANRVSVKAADGTLLVDQASLAVNEGELVALVGPNGAGKSSLVRCLAGVEAARQGQVTLNGQGIAALPPLARAQMLAYLPQSRPLAWPLSVHDTVALGRFSFGGVPGRLSKPDEAAVEAALAETAITHLAQRRTDTLSGGEMARVHIARSLATHAPMLIADEPLAALDPLHQWQIMTLLRRHVARGNSAILVLHDLSLAAQFADRIIWMKDRMIVADGTPEQTLTTQRMAEVYNVAARITDTFEVIVTGPASPHFTQKIPPDPGSA